MEAKKLTNIKDLLDLITNKWRTFVGVIDARGEVDSSSANDILVVNECSEDEVISKLHNSESLHIVSSSKNDIKNELNSAALMLCSPETFFKFPLASVFHPEDSNMFYENKYKIIDYKFNSSKDKYKALILFEVEMEKLALNDSILSTIRSIADELYTNAMFNAPSTSAGSGPTDRKSFINYPEGKSASLFLGKDENYILVGCSDPYGSLDVEAFSQRLFKSCDSGVASVMNMDGEGGAGIGTYMMYDASVNIYVGVDEGQQTTVMCMIPYKVSSRKIKRMTKNIHFLNKKINKENKGG